MRSITNGMKIGMKKAGNREKLLMIVAVVSIVVVIGDNLILTPLMNFWDERSKRIGELREFVARGEALLEREDSVRRRWLKMKKESLSQQLSLAENDVYKAVDRWAADSQISFTSLKPHWQDYDDEHEYKTLECRATGFGTLQEISRFLYELEHDPLSLRIEDFEIAARSNEADSLTLSLRFSGLVLLPAEEI